MALSLIGVGTTANDGTGDPLRTAFQTVNTALTAVNNAIVVGTDTTTFKDDGGTTGLNVLANGDVTFTNAGGTVGSIFDASANSNSGGWGVGTASPTTLLEVSGGTSTPFRLHRASASASVGVAFSLLESVGGRQDYATIFGNVISNTVSAETGALIFQVSVAGALATVATLRPSGTLNLNSLPTSTAGLVSGDLWNNSGVLNVV